MWRDGGSPGSRTVQRRNDLFGGLSRLLAQRLAKVERALDIDTGGGDPQRGCRSPSRHDRDRVLACQGSSSPENVGATRRACRRDATVRRWSGKLRTGQCPVVGVLGSRQGVGVNDERDCDCLGGHRRRCRVGGRRTAERVRWGCWCPHTPAAAGLPPEMFTRGRRRG